MEEIIIKLRSEGKSYKEICNELKIAKSTVSYYIGQKNTKLPRVKCRNCEKSIIGSKTFCSKDCYINFNSKERIKKLESGSLLCNDTIRLALITKFGDICNICEKDSIWNNKKLTLHVDHIDGNSDNNNFNNLRLLCPNCHSQLETSKCKNKKQTKRNNYLRKYKGYIES